MIIVVCPILLKDKMRIDEITGSSPYGASTIVGGKGEECQRK